MTVMDKRMIDCAVPLSLASIQSFKNDGTFAFGRYLNPGWKQLTLFEKEAILKAGCHIVSIFETGGYHLSYFTKSRGIVDARLASELAKRLGQPVGTPIFFAVDCETGSVADMNKVRDYFTGIYQGIESYKVGVYGSEFTCDNAHADFYFQTFAWSYGKSSKRACIYQSDNDVTEHGARVDDDKIGGGYWPLDVPHVIQVSHPLLKLTKPFTVSNDVKELQKALTHHGISCSADGVFGPGTDKCVKEFQSSRHLVADGIVGPRTWAELDK